MLLPSEYWNFLPNYNASSLPSNRQVFFAGRGVVSHDLL
jgi:hypothetical protein